LYYFNLTAHTIRSADPQTKQLTKKKSNTNANEELRRNSHHSHHNLFEIVLDIPHVRDGLRAEYERQPRAQFVLISQITEEEKHVLMGRNGECVARSMENTNPEHDAGDAKYDGDEAGVVDRKVLRRNLRRHVGSRRRGLTRIVRV